MKTKSIKIFLTFVISLFFGVNVFAQQFKPHAVKKGETLESISSRYNVSIDDILVYNREISKGQKLTPYTILIVPTDKKKPAVSNEEVKNVGESVTEAIQEKPIRFISHKTKRKENLYRLSKEYNVTEEDIKRYNKTLYSEQLKKGMMLNIPVYKKVNVSVATNYTTTTNTVVTTDPKPSGFNKYRVKKRETLQDIARKFKLTEAQLKKYNKDLYSSRLKKGTVVKIPRFDKVKVEKAKHSIPLKNYIVKPKETRWSIAHKFGITVDSLLFFNPDLPRTTDYLGAGHTLKIPDGVKELKGEVREKIVTKETTYVDYTVPAGMTYYRIKSNYGISEEEVKKLNPSVRERGLQKGMVIKVPSKKVSQEVKMINAEINADNYIFYIVKQGEGEMALSRNLKVPYSEIVKYNPELLGGIKKGMAIKLPKFNEGNLNIKNSLVIPAVSLLDSINTVNRPNIIVMLPFRLDKVNVANKEDATKGIKNSTLTQYSLGLYSGMLIATDYIKEYGVSVHIKTIDTQRNLERVKSLLSLGSLSGVSAIVGPLDTAQLGEVAKRAKTFNVPVISPTSSSGTSTHDNIFYSVPTDESLRKKILDYAQVNYDKQNVIVIADNKSKEASDAIVQRFPNAKVVGLIKELTIDYEHFQTLLTEGDNWVFVETTNPNVAKSASSLINSLNIEPISIKMFTTNATRTFDRNKMDITVLSALNFTYPSTNKELKDKKFVSLYKKKFGTSPDRFAVRGFDLMYDLLLKLSYKNSLFDASINVGQTEYNANKFNYQHDPGKGYYNTSSYIMKYDGLRIVEETAKK